MNKELENILKLNGWYEGRALSTEYIKARYKRHEYPLFDKAIQFLTEFADLTCTINLEGKKEQLATFNMDRVLNQYWYEQQVYYYKDTIPRPFTMVGLLGRANAAVLIDDKGVFYCMHPIARLRIGFNTQEALEFLLLHKQGPAFEVLLEFPDIEAKLADGTSYLKDIIKPPERQQAEKEVLAFVRRYLPDWTDEGIKEGLYLTGPGMYMIGADALYFMDAFAEKFGLDMSAFDANKYIIGENPADGCLKGCFLSPVFWFLLIFDKNKIPENHQFTFYHMAEVVMRGKWFDPE